MGIFKKALWTIALSISAASFAVSGSKTYDVSAVLLHQGDAFASPSAVVKEGVPAINEVHGQDGYRLSLTVTEIARDEIKVDATVNSPHGTITLTVTVRPRQPATVTIGDLGLILTVKRSGS